MLQKLTEEHDRREASLLAQLKLPLQKGFWVRGVFIYYGDARRHGVRRSKRFGEKAFGRFGIAYRAQKELERVADRESTARERYIQVFLILTEVSSTRQKSLVALRCWRQRFSSAGA